MEIDRESNVPIRPDGGRFADRSEAGALLAEHLRSRTFYDPLILALPRGGVPVAYEVARRLGIPMEVLVARKIGAPGNREYAIGAIVEGGFHHLNHAAIDSHHIDAARVVSAIETEQKELRRRIALYRLDLPLPRVKGRDVILIDDGIATGETARVACRLLADRGARRIILAVPVCSARRSAHDDFPEANELIALYRPADFRSVGRYYVRFNPVSDDAVIHLAARGREFGSSRTEPFA